MTLRFWKTSTAPPLLWLLVLAALLLPAQAQVYEIKGGTFNNLYARFPGGTAAGPPADPAPPRTPGQFEGVGTTSASAGPISISGTYRDQYPATSNTGAAANQQFVLRGAGIGSTFASGVPRYFFGDEMTPPLVNYLGVEFAGANDAAKLAAARLYWRPQPILAGETFSGNVLDTPTGSNLGTTPITAGTEQRLYWSKHAERVFANQPGRVTIRWVTRAPEAGSLRSREETFAVSATAIRPVRTIFWTERSFDGPLVNVEDNRITAVSAAFYGTAMPETVATEVVVPGFPAQTPAITKTFWLEKLGNLGQFHAYNVEGRLFIEYLGNIRAGSGTDAVFESLGYDVVEIVRAPIVSYQTVKLGDRILPHDGDPALYASPKFSVTQGAKPYSGFPQADGSTAYYAERETGLPNVPEDDLPQSIDAYNDTVFYWLEEGNFGIQWPKFQDRYWLRWPKDTELEDFAHYTTRAGGSTAETGVQFNAGSLPQVVYQDDGGQAEARVDIQTQRLVVDYGTSAGTVLDPVDRNRSLLRFSADGKVWYVRLYSQSESRSGFQEGDELPAINTTATVGSRINAPAGHEVGGYIAGGTCHFPEGYLNPFTAGMETAALGAVIPVNARPADNLLTVWWFKKVEPPDASFQPFYVPAKIGRYTVSFPADTPPKIIIASGIGTDDLPPSEAAGEIYVQNNSALPGYNPNEEHALLYNGRAYALRDDFNITSGGGYTSQPFVLVAYTDPNDDRPAMHAYKVVREQVPFTFNYTSTAGTLLNPPMPLLVMPLPLENGASKNIEITGTDNPAGAGATGAVYTGFTFQDRKGFTWVHRGPHQNQQVLTEARYGTASTYNIVTAIIQNAITTGTPVLVNNTTMGGDPIPGQGKSLTVYYRTETGTGTATVAENATYTPPADRRLTMKLYYKSQDGFFFPGLGSQPAVGTIVPFLRAAGRSGQAISLTQINNGQTDEPLPIYYRPVWPLNPPELRVAETLTLPKFGLPQVRGQASSEVFYEQSIAQLGTAKNSVTLHDPTQNKLVLIDAAGVGLTKLPAAIRTSSYAGRTYFQGLPPHLQQRFYFDPLQGTKGGLVFTGQFVDEIAGEDYLNLNLLTDAEETLLKNLCPGGDADETKWDAAIDNLGLTLVTMKPNPALAGTVVQDTTLAVGENEVARVTSPNTLVDSYAVSASGQGAGFVTMVFGNGINPGQQPVGDPVQVKIFKVVPQLYTGDLKVLLSSNPLDEQVTLRHSGDYAGRPQDYEYEWRWAPAGSGTAPPVYTYSWAKTVGDPLIAATKDWKFVRNPGAERPADAQYAAASTLPFPRGEAVNTAGYNAASGLPGIVIKSVNGADYTAGVPAQLVFSAECGDLDGFVFYVNGAAAVAFNAPAGFSNTGATTGLSTGGLSKQFSVSPGFFSKGPNVIEVALFTGADADVPATLDFRLEASVETDVVSAPNWFVPNNGDGTNVTTVGSQPTLPFGGPSFVLNDRWFTMRYRPKASTSSVAGIAWSRWMPPGFVEGWVKRVLAAINPFEQRVKDLFNNAVNTDVSVLTQAGTKWEGDIALTLGNVNDVGLIEIYETVLNRARAMSIDANTSDADSNNALLLVTSYLNDLYQILGNEAFSDAANPTISLDDQDTVTEVNTSRFSFESQVRSVLDEELALLRGRDDFLSPGVNTAPAYNRLYWNYTRGINSGEVLYAVNYNIKEKAGSSTANGVIDEADAQRMFPQAHGDAYGHFLTALSGYYRLLTNTYFTWTPRAEAVTVLGQAVTIDYMDERKFSSAAAALARSAEQVCTLTHRQLYKDDPAQGWSHYRDGKNNAATNTVRRQGLDEWAARGQMGAYLHWVTGNAMLPDEDTNPNHTGVQIIDRTTVTELSALVATAASFQTILDNASAHLNPLGLSANAIAFDISPDDMEDGESHFEQIYDRAVAALNNAAGAFNASARMTRLLRNQENQVDDFNTAIVDQERSYKNELIEIYGRPYAGDIGVGKTYAQDYDGPDTQHWFVVNRPDSLVDTTTAVSLAVRVPTGINTFTGNAIADIQNAYTAQTVQKTLTVNPSSFVQYADVWAGTGPPLGQRAAVGELQQALLDEHQSYIEFKEAVAETQVLQARFTREAEIFTALVASHVSARSTRETAQTAITVTQTVQGVLNALAQSLVWAGEAARDTGDTVATALPTVIGLASDATSIGRAAAKGAGFGAKYGFNIAAGVANAAAGALEAGVTAMEMDLEEELEALGFKQEEMQQAYEFELLYRELVAKHYELAQLATEFQRSSESLRSILARADRLLSEREIFRQRAAAVIQGYRTRDLTFRTFRNEALEQYRSLFDLASRYSYLAAKSYDYETGLLGTPEGSALIAGIVSSRSLGDISSGVPLINSSSTGDAGLATVLAQLNSDFAVAEGRLGINNPDNNGTVFSLRHELFRLLNDPNVTSDDDAWRQTLEQHFTANVLSDPDVAALCRSIAKPDGTAVPGIVVPFSSTIEHGKNFFGLPLAAGDHAFSPSHFTTKISSAGVILRGYVGMDAYATGEINAAGPATSDPNALSATPYVYLIPAGTDYMYAPSLGDTGVIRAWTVHEQALPLPYNLGATDFNAHQFFDANGTLSSQPWVQRKHSAVRAVDDSAYFYNFIPEEFVSNRLIGRSVWNSAWKIVIPAYTLLNNEQEGLNRFAASVTDIQIFLRTYSNSGN